MSVYQSVYSDVVKDVIGDEPVVDQFDIYYAASFYNAMIDDYVTGTMLNVTFNGNIRNFSLPSSPRGRFFSKYYASSQPSLPVDAETLLKYPMQSSRLESWSSKVSRTAYRINQAFSDGERHYDSCLPDLKRCFSVDGSKVWTISNTNDAFSPYGNVVTSSVGYMLFNSINFDRSDEGYDSDPTINNSWLRSFPFEARYLSAERKTTNNVSIVDQADLIVDWNRPKLDTLFPEISGSFQYSTPSALQIDSLYRRNSKATKEDIDISGVVEKRQLIDSFVPIVPGYLENAPANALRAKLIADGDWARVPVNMTNYAGLTARSREEGYSLLLAGDVNLSKTVSHDYLSNYSGITIPSAEYLTSSMTYNDTIKFLFGFGDVNTTSYARRNYSIENRLTQRSLIKNESFETTPIDTVSTGISTYSDQYFTVNWNVALPAGLGWSEWKVASKDGEYDLPIPQPPIYKYWVKSGSLPSSTNKGIYWASNASDTRILVSDTDAEFGGGQSSGETSAFIIDITSSCPWTFSYDWALVASTASSLETYFSSVPGYTPNDIFLNAYAGAPALPALYVQKEYGLGTDEMVMQNYDFMIDGFFTGSQYNKEYPLPPGNWRFVATFNSSSSGTGTNPSFAAVNNFKFYAFKDLEKTEMIGSNNLPDFKKKVHDPRFNPTIDPRESQYDQFYSGINLHVTGSSELYKSYVVGVSPTIRGWKYGLQNGFPSFSKAVFRRDRFGQFRDMLEQRQYTKYINSQNSLLGVTEEQDQLTGKNSQFENAGVSVVEVNFVKQRYRKNDKGVGYIYNEKVDPLQTYSQNLSPEVTSSLPYFDGVARHRQETDLQLVSNSNLSSIQFNSSGLTVT